MNKQIWLHLRLFHAIKDNDIDTVNVLIEKGIDFAHIPTGYSPLSNAVTNCRVEILEILMKNRLIFQESDIPFGNIMVSPFYYAVHNNYKKVVDILIDNNIYLTTDNIHTDLIDKIIEHDNIKAMNMLSNDFVLWNVKHNYYYSKPINYLSYSLKIAHEQKRTKIIKILVKHPSKHIKLPLPDDIINRIIVKYM